MGDDPNSHASGASSGGAGRDTWSEADETGPIGDPGKERYTLIKEIGRGAMGRVWLARDTVLDRDVAYKELVIEATPYAVSRFLREARLTARLDHPTIVPVHDAGRAAGGGLFYVMRLLRGRSLYQALREAPDLAARLRWLDGFVSVCQGIAHAHEHGVIHRDLKPANLMIGHYGEIQVVDWGLAKLLVEQAPDTGLEDTNTGAIVGTPLYMSPEQATGKTLTAATDVWSLGVMLFELLTGAVPFDDPDPWAILRAVATHDAPEVLALSPQAPPELAAITRRALSRDLATRYPDARELLADLESWRAGTRVSAHRYTAWEEVRLLIRRHRVPLIGLAAAGAAALLVGSASVGRVVAERDRARSAERAAVDARAEVARVAQAALVSQALAHDDDPVSAMTFAAEALRLGPEPTARGVIARMLGTEPWQFDRKIPAGPAPCADFATAGGRYACAGNGGSWVADEGGLRWSDPEPTSRVGLSRDGQWVALAHPDGSLALRDADTGETRWENPNGGRFLASPVFSPDATRIAWSAERTLLIADTATGEQVSRSSWNSLVGGISWTAPETLDVYFADSVTRQISSSGEGLAAFTSAAVMRGLYDGDFSSSGDRLLGLAMDGRVTWQARGADQALVLREAGSAGRAGIARGDRAAWEADSEGVVVWRLPGGEALGRLPGVLGRADLWMDEADRLYVPTPGAIAVYRRGGQRIGSWHRPDPFHLCSAVSGGRIDCLAGTGLLLRYTPSQVEPEVLSDTFPLPVRGFATDDAKNVVLSHGSQLQTRINGEEVTGARGEVTDLAADRHRTQLLHAQGGRIGLSPWPTGPATWTDVGAPVVAFGEVPGGWLVLTESGFVSLDRGGGATRPTVYPPSDYFVADPLTGRIATWEVDRVAFRAPDGSAIGPGWAASAAIDSRRARFAGVFVAPDRFALIDGADVVVLDIPTGQPWARLVAHPRLADLVAMLDEHHVPNGQLATVGFDRRLVVWDLPAVDGDGPALAARVAATTGWRLQDGRVVPAAP